MAVNALDSLTPVQRSEVLNRTLASDISCELGKATSLAAQQGQDLYLPAGLWLIKADKSWDINILNNTTTLN